MKLSYLGYLLAFLATAQGASQLRGSRHADDIGSTGIYRIILLHDIHQAGDDSVHDEHQIVTSPIVDGVESHKHFDIELPEHIIAENEDLLYSGNLIIEATDSHINEQDNKVVLSEDSVISVMEESRRPKRRLAVSGTRTFAVLRVTMQQSGETCDYSKSEIEYQLFQKPGVSLVDQMDACSNGAVRMVSAGVHELVLPGKVADYGHQAQIKDLALNTFAASKGLKQVRDFADHIMVIIPKSNYNFIGTGETGLTIINVNNQWALDLTVYMHETGHNMGLGDGRVFPNNALDNTAIMGMAPPSPNLNGPRKCYNAPSNAKLGFFSERTMAIDLMSNPKQKITIASFAEVDKGYKADPVLLKFGEYSLQYNYVTGINSGTEWFKNDIIMGWYDGGNPRIMEPPLAPNGAITEVAGFFNTGKTLRVEACESISGTSTKPNSMTVALTLGISGSPCAVAGTSDPPPPPTTQAPPPTTQAPPVTTKAPPVTTQAPPVTTKAPPVTTVPPPPVTTTPAPPQGECVKNTSIRLCRRDRDGCIWSAANGCVKVTAQVCAKLSRRQCRKTRGCSIDGNFCTVTPATTGPVQCSNMKKRACRRNRSCTFQDGQCQDKASSARDVFVPAG